MSTKLKILYACNDIPARSFIIMIDPQTTCEDLLKIISERRKNKYKTLFFEYSQVDDCDAVKDFWETDPNSIFYASTNDELPTEEFMQAIINTKKKTATNTQSSKSSTKKHDEKPKREGQLRNNTELEYTFYFTGSTIDHLLKGIKIYLDIEMDLSQCQKKLQQILIDNKVNIKNKQLLLYYSCGIPFVSGKLSDIYANKDFRFKKILYGVLTRKISESLLNECCINLHNINYANYKLLISPLCDSSERGFSDMVCLIEYLKQTVNDCNLFLNASSAVIHFAPMILSLYKIVHNHDEINGRDIVNFCSTFFTFFRGNLPSNVSDGKVFQYALRICNLITRIENAPKNIPISQFRVKRGEPDPILMKKQERSRNIYAWKVDIGCEFNYVNLDLRKRFKEIKNSFETDDTFKPIAPLSIRLQSSCKIVKGKNHEYFFVQKSLFKNCGSLNMAEIIDPMTGKTESKDNELFAKEQKGNPKDLIDPDTVKQIIMVNFDESKSMIGDIGGYLIVPITGKSSRFEIAIQYLTTFIGRIYGYKIPCFLGLVSFNDKITIRCPLTPLIPDFEEEGLKNINPNSTTKLWDSLMYSCNEIVKFRKNDNGEETFKNATSRILVISDGEDVNSTAKVEDVVKELIKNKIIVDSVIISNEDDCQMLCSVCHATGGFSFRPNDIEDGISLFENTAFLNLEERKFFNGTLINNDRSTTPSRIKPKMITADFMNKAKSCAKFDENIINKELNYARKNLKLTTPLTMISRNHRIEIKENRTKRILRELALAYKETNEEYRYSDPEIKVFIIESCIDKWKIFLRSPEEYYYGIKWWQLHVTFPNNYPIEPPLIRFVTVPYHLNISQDGMICMFSNDSNYTQDDHVIDMIQKIKEIFLIPLIETPLDIKIYQIYLKNPDRYRRFTKQSARDEAKDDYRDFVSLTAIIDEVPSYFKYSDIEKPPQSYMMSDSEDEDNKRKMVLGGDGYVKASSGVYYKKEELKRLIASNKNPVCVITGKVLTEKKEDLESSDDPI